MNDWFVVRFEVDSGEVVLLDQRRLPGEVHYLRCGTLDQVADGIRDMVVRGAPAIGLTAAYGMVMHARQELDSGERSDASTFLVTLGAVGKALNATRPTAVNLSWAVARMARKASEVASLDPKSRYQAMLGEARAMHQEDAQACHTMGKLGAEDVPEGATVLTHCNAGALATGGYGTALGVIRAAHEAGKNIRVLACETRPYLQGARLTAWELHQDGIPVEVICDNMAGHLMSRGEVQFVVVGADRVAANGDVANKVGTYSHAVLANHHGIPFTVAAPWSTVDVRTATGSDIEIEQRPPDEVARCGDRIVVPQGVPCRHPAFDVTPANFIDALYTDRGRFEPKGGWVLPG